MKGLRISLRGLSARDAELWIELVCNSWRVHPKALPLQIVGLSMMGLLISQSSLPMAQWLPLWGSMIAVWVAVIFVALRSRRVQIDAANYSLWRALLLGWRAVHGVAGGVLFALLYGALTPEWRLPLLITAVVFTYGLTFYAIEDLGLAMVGSAPVAACLLVALLAHGRPADYYIALLLVAASINCWLAGSTISRRLFEAARTRQRNAVLVSELAREVDEVKRAKARADQANREKSEFFAAASHDLRQPLYSLQLLSDHLRKQLESAQHIEIADKLGAALTSMRHLFERMFDVARIEAQKVACQPQHLPVRELFASLDHEFACVCREKNLRWTVEATDDWIWADAVLAQRMLRNLLENAVRYTAQGEVRLRARRRGEWIYCQVWDSGVGIAKPDQPKVFDDYFQVQNAARRAQDGLGLGLGVVRRLVALTGSKIVLRSRPGRGSCFSLALPAGRPVARAAPADAAELMQQADSPCVLVLDDEPAVLDAVLTILKDSGYLALGGSSTAQAIQQAALRNAWPRAVICDYRLGDVHTGLDAIAAIRYEFGDDLPAILVTGDLGPQIKASAAQQGIRVMHKPLDRHQLLLAVQQALASEQAAA